MKIKICLLPISLFFLFSGPATGQEMKVANLTSTAGLGVGNFEPASYAYDFLAPLNSAWLCKNGYQGALPTGTVLTEGAYCADPTKYTAGSSSRYFMSVFGPRMQASGGAISSLYDFHRGEDIVDGKSPAAELEPEIRCMCAGIVHKIYDETDLTGGETIEQTETGRYVTVKCNATFNGNAAMGNIYTAYRHLSEINAALAEGAAISRAAVIGKMGSSGVTSVKHLHLSAQKMVNNNLINVHPMRLFNPAANRHLLLTMDAAPFGNATTRKLQRANLTVLATRNNHIIPDSNWAIFRLAVPFQKANIRAVVIKNGTYNEKVDFEEISETRDGDVPWLDNPVVGKLKLYVYPFNRYQTAYDRFNSIKADLASFEHTGNQYAIANSGIFTVPAYVIDIKASGLPKNFSKTAFEIYVLDIWGKGVKGTL